MMRLQKKHWFLLAAALATVLLVAFQGEQKEAQAVAEPAVRANQKHATKERPATASIPLDKLNRPEIAGDAIDLFSSKSWYVPPPPPPPPKPAPPPPPSAPPLPFTYMGKMQESPERLVIFLVRGDRMYSVSPGDVIDGIYHVDEVTENQLAITYLPLNIKQTLSIGETS